MMQSRDRKITTKQKKFVKEYLQNGGNGTRAVLAVYDTKDPNVAKVIASENLTKPNIRESVIASLEAVGLSDIYISELLRKATESGIGQRASNADSLRGIDMLLKLKGVYPDKKTAHVRVEVKEQFENKSLVELKKDLATMNEQTKQLLQDIQH